MSNDETGRLDPFVVSLNHGETFGVFGRQGDIYNEGDTPQGLFFEGSRHISLLEFELDGSKPLLLSSTIREDNDCLTVDLANRKFTSKFDAHQNEIPESTIHIKKTKKIKNEAFYESMTFQNFNMFTTTFSCVIKFGADFSDVFELRGFKCETPTQSPRALLKDGALIFCYHGRDGILRSSEIRFEGAKIDAGNEKATFTLELAPMESKTIDLSVVFSRQVPDSKAYLFEGELNRKSLSLSDLKTKLPGISTSNPHFNHWVARSSLDLMALMSCYGDNLYPMAGVPWYNTPFGRDGIITAFQTLFAAPFIAKNTLLFLAHYQAKTQNDLADAEPGKILHELRKGELANIGALPFKKYYGAVDSTFLYIWLSGLYFFRSGDRKTLDKIWPSIENALAWIQESADLDGDGFFEYQKRNPAGLDNQCWKDSWDSISHRDGKLAETPLALCEVQGYAYQAFLSAKKLYQLKGERDKAEFYDKQANKLKDQFNKKFWSRENGFYALALDGKKKPCHVFSSNPGHALSTRIADTEKAKIVGDRLFESDLFSGWGVRTLGSDEKRFNPMSYHNGSVWPHDNSLIAYGLKKYGQISNFNKLTTALFDTAVNMDLMRLPELFCGFDRTGNEPPTLYPVSCAPQAWASGVVFMLIESMLGLNIKRHKKEIGFDRPCLPEFLDWIEILDICLGDEGTFSLLAKRVSEDEATVEIFSRPAGWKVFISK